MDISDLTGLEIVQKLIERDNYVTNEFFFKKCKQMFKALIYEIGGAKNGYEYDDLINELYIYLLETNQDGIERLRTYQGKCSIYGWLKLVAYRFFVQKITKRVIEYTYSDPPYDVQNEETDDDDIITDINLESLLMQMPNQRYAGVLREWFFEEREPKDIAAEMDISVDNLYNIKKRALKQLEDLIKLRNIDL